MSTTATMSKEQARELEKQFEDSLRAMGVLVPGERRVSTRYGHMQWEVDYPNVPDYRHHSVPLDKRNYGVVLITGESRYSTPRRKKAIHRELPDMLDRVAKLVNMSRERLLKNDDEKMMRAQKDFDRSWCAHRHGLTCKLINGRFHALVRVGANEIWQDDVEYAVSHDTLVFKSEIGKVNRWITIETLQKLLDHGVLLNPADVKFVSDTEGC